MAVKMMQANPDRYMAFANDPAKQKRYQEFIEGKVSTDRSLSFIEREKERDEFAKIAGITRGVPASMSSRFVAATKSDLLPPVSLSPLLESRIAIANITTPLQDEPEIKQEDYQETAAQMQMFGRLTRYNIMTYDIVFCVIFAHISPSGKKKIGLHLDCCANALISGIHIRERTDPRDKSRPPQLELICSWIALDLHQILSLLHFPVHRHLLQLLQ